MLNKWWTPAERFLGADLWHSFLGRGELLWCEAGQTFTGELLTAIAKAQGRVEVRIL